MESLLERNYGKRGLELCLCRESGRRRELETLADTTPSPLNRTRYVSQIGSCLFICGREGERPVCFQVRVEIISDLVYCDAYLYVTDEPTNNFLLFQKDIIAVR